MIYYKDIKFPVYILGMNNDDKNKLMCALGVKWSSGCAIEDQNMTRPMLFITENGRCSICSAYAQEAASIQFKDIVFEKPKLHYSEIRFPCVITSVNVRNILIIFDRLGFKLHSTELSEVCTLRFDKVSNSVEFGYIGNPHFRRGEDIYDANDINWDKTPEVPKKKVSFSVLLEKTEGGYVIADIPKDKFEDLHNSLIECYKHRYYKPEILAYNYSYKIRVNLDIMCNATVYSFNEIQFDMWYDPDKNTSCKRARITPKCGYIFTDRQDNYFKELIDSVKELAGIPIVKKKEYKKFVKDRPKQKFTRHRVEYKQFKKEN